MVRVLPPWFENLKKRQVKSPRIYIRDTGVLHALHNIVTNDNLSGHPKLGASWEGFVVEQLLSFLPARQAYFWSTHAGAELDLMAMMNGKRYGFECKYADAPGKTKSMRVAIKDLDLAHLCVIYPGKERYKLDDCITAIPAGEIPILAGHLKKGQGVD